MHGRAFEPHLPAHRRHAPLGPAPPAAGRAHPVGARHGPRVPGRRGAGRQRRPGRPAPSRCARTRRDRRPVLRGRRTWPARYCATATQAADAARRGRAALRRGPGRRCWPRCTRSTRRPWGSATSAARRLPGAAGAALARPVGTGRHPRRCPTRQAARRLAGALPAGERRVDRARRLPRSTTPSWPPTTSATIRAIVDWEMATLGRPARRPRPAPRLLGPGLRPGAGRRGTCRRANSGFPPGARAGPALRGDLRPGPRATWPSTSASGYFKLAVIAEGIHARHLAGRTVGPGFERVGSAVPALLRSGLELLP